jgi:anti-anti-sigma factor
VVDDGYHRLVVDLAGLTYIASAGVGIMINYFQQVSEKGGCLHIACPTPSVKEIFNLLGLEALLRIFADRDTAITVAAS